MKNFKKKQFAYKSGIKVDDRYATYFEYVVHTQEFIDEVTLVRKEFDIPEGGIDEFPSTIDSNNFFEVIDSTNFDIPERIDDNPLFWKRVTNFCNKFGFDEDSWFVPISEYIVFDSYNPFSFGHGYAVFNISGEPKNVRSFSDAYAKTYPVAILIDPYTSLTELHDLIDGIYKTKIEPIQKRLRNPNSKMTKIKRTTSKMVPVYELIKNNLNLPVSEVVSKINRKFKLNWDYTRVDKIIREKKYRRSP